MKESIIKARKCRLKICGKIYSPKNNKGAYCCESHRLLDNKNRREERDRLFNLLLKKLKDNYHILLLYQVGTILDVNELKNIGFHFDYMPQLDDEMTYWFGKLGLRTTKNINYQLIHRNNENK
jgi:hypothetical protein